LNYYYETRQQSGPQSKIEIKVWNSKRSWDGRADGRKRQIIKKVLANLK